MQKPVLTFKPARVLACTVLALGVGFTAAAIASPDTVAPRNSATTAEASERSSYKKMHRRGDVRHGHHHRRMSEGALMVPGYGPVPKDVVDSLSLNDQQTALLDEARSFVQEQRKARHEHFRAKGQGATPAVETPLDPRAALQRQDERFSAMQALRAEAAQKWLTVWDSLDAEQQETVSRHVAKQRQERAERAAQYREKREARNAAKS